MTPQRSPDKRFTVNTENRFDVLNLGTEEPRSLEGNRGIEGQRKAISMQGPDMQIHGNPPKTTRYPFLHIFTVERLDNQFHFFSLTKYAHPVIIKAAPLPPVPTLPDTPQNGRMPVRLESPRSYIPPHRRCNTRSPPINPSPPHRSFSHKLEYEAISISSKEVEATWDKCQKRGIFAIWNGPQEELPLLIDWLEENCEDQVSISSFSTNALFLQCLDESIKKEFLLVSKCFFNGHCVKFIDWSHNFNIDLVDCIMPSWFPLPSLPPEIFHEDIIKALGSVVGEVRGIDASFYCCNDVKILINVSLNHPTNFKKLLKTSKAQYEINFQNYKGKIVDILKFDDLHKIMPKILPLTSDFRSIFPWLRAMKYKSHRGSDEQRCPAESQIQEDQKERMNYEVTDTVSPKKRKFKSIIVSNPKEYAETNLDGNNIRKPKRHKKKAADKHGQKERKHKTGKSKSSPKQQIVNGKINIIPKESDLPSTKITEKNIDQEKETHNTSAEHDVRCKESKDGRRWNYAETSNNEEPPAKEKLIEPYKRKGNDKQGELQLRELDLTDTYDLGEAENNVLFASPKA